jgi:Arc/MetJ-type ribon-helix-helix transcriptional regulator
MDRMFELTIRLPESDVAWMRHQVAIGKFASMDELVSHLIKKGLSRTTPAHRRVMAKKRK